MSGKKVVVLGATGMLGAMVATHLQEQSQFQVITTTRSSKKKSHEKYFNALEFVADPDSKNWQFLDDADYIINCIGIIKPFCHDDNMAEVQTAIRVNALFPHLLVQRLDSSATKMLQIATDCVYSGRQGKYRESDLHDATDVYGQTKSLGEVRASNMLNIRCSIVGPEQGTSKSLLEWFLGQAAVSEPQVTGFTNHFWNGITTLQFAQLCQRIIESGQFDQLRTEHYAPHFIPNTTVTKHQLLELFQEYFKTQITIKPAEAPGQPIDRTLSTEYSLLAELFPAQDMATAIKDVAEFVATHPDWRQRG